MGKASSGQNAARRTVAGQENAKTEGVPAGRARASGQSAAGKTVAGQENAKTEGVPASRAKASGQHAGKIAGKIAGQEGSAGAENVFAGTGSAPGRNVGGGPGQAGAGVSQGAGGKQGAARCEEIQEPALANARGGIRSTLEAGVEKSRESADQSARVEQLVSRLGGDTLAFVKGSNVRCRTETSLWIRAGSRSVAVEAAPL